MKFVLPAADAANKKTMSVKTFVNRLSTTDISQERKRELEPLKREIQSRLAAGKTVLLNFICTHNSRRSQFAQVWAYTLAHRLGLEGVVALSGGTEVTAVHPNTVKTLLGCGYTVETEGPAENPVYVFRSEPNIPPLKCYSKLYDCEENLNDKKFIAVMTCASAADDCPFIPDAEMRFSMTYDDPGASDGSDREKETYEACNKQIATEMLYVLGSEKEQLMKEIKD